MVTKSPGKQNLKMLKVKVKGKIVENEKYVSKLKPTVVKDGSHNSHARDFLFQLALHNTPIHDWKLQRVAAEYCIAIKRDDMTGITMSGNKVFFI